MLFSFINWQGESDKKKTAENTTAKKNWILPIRLILANKIINVCMSRDGIQDLKIHKEHQCALHSPDGILTEYWVTSYTIKN